MTDKERRIAGISTERDFGNGVYGYDKEVLDAATSPWLYDGEIIVRDDAEVKAVIARQMELDAIAEAERRNRSLGTPALYLTAA